MTVGTTSSYWALAAGLIASAVPLAQAQAQQAQAQAQDTPPAADTVAPTPGQQQGQPEPASGIADIIVTASRRETTLQKTAIPVTAITADTLVQKGVSNATELTKLAPALKIGAVASGGFQVTMRGVGNFGGNALNEPGVSLNLDGVYLARSQGPTGVFYDVKRVEILKGPQGTLYGRNTTGGVVNVITNDPTDQLGGDLTAELGNYALKRATGAINLPIADGIALRVAGQGIDRNGYLSDGYNDEKSLSGRVKLKLDPTDALSILLEANYAQSKGKGFNFVFNPFVDPDDPYVGPSDPRSNANFNIPGIGPLLPRIRDDGFVNNRSRGLQATVAYKLDFATASVIVANARNTVNYLQYSAGFPVREDTRNRPNYYTTAEFRLNSNGDGPFKWVLGGFYFKDDVTSTVQVDQGITFGSTDVTVRTRSYSGFGEATYALTPALRLTAGGRYTSDEKAITGRTAGPASPCAPPSALGVDPVRGAVCVTPDNGATTFNKFTYKLGAEFDIGPRSLLYATYATGYKAGGFIPAPNVAAAGDFPTNAFRPENLSAITVGSKNRFLDNTLQFNVEGFYWKYKDKQVSHLGFVPPNNVLLVTDNAADATVYGAEVEALWEPTPNDDIIVDIQYLHTNYDDYRYNAVIPGYAQPFAPGSSVPGPTTGCAVSPTVGLGGAPRGVGVPGISIVDCSGRTVSNAPKWVVNLSYRHTFALPGGSTIVPGVSTHIESSFVLGEEYFTGQFQRSSMVSDADVTWLSADKRLSLTAFIQNIEDKAVGQSSFLQPTVQKALINLRAPRTFGVRAGVRF